MTDIHVIRGALRAAVRAICDFSEERQGAVLGQVLEALQVLAERSAELASPRAFRKELQDLGLKQAQANRLIKVLDVRKETLGAVLTALATVPPKQATTEGLYEALVRYIASGWCHNLVAGQALRRTRAPALDDNEYTQLMAWMSGEDMGPDVRVQALALMVAYVRSGHAASDAGLELARAGQLDEAVHAVEVCLSKTRLRLRLSFTGDGAPVAHLASSSDYGLRDEDDIGNPPRFVDAAVRDATDPSAIHMAIGGSVLRNVDRWPAEVVAGVRNGIHLGVEPFQPSDRVGSLTFVSPSWLDGRPASAKERPVLESLTMNAMLGAQVNVLRVDPLDAVRFDHLVIGGTSDALGGLALGPRELVERAARQVVAVVRLLRGWAPDEVPGSLLDNAGIGLLLRYPSWARSILMEAREDLVALADQSDQDLDPVGERIVSRLDRASKESLPGGPRRHVERPEQADAERILERMRRDRTFEELQRTMDWDCAAEARMADARDHFSAPIWEAMVHVHRSRKKN